MALHSKVGDASSSTVKQLVGIAPSLDSSSMDNDTPVQLWMDENDPYINCEDSLLINYPIIEEGNVAEGYDMEKVHYVEEEIHAVQEHVEEVVVGDKLQPCVGMEFSSVDEAYNFYNAYGCHAGFGIRRNSFTRSRSVVTSVKFVCYKEGFSKSQLAEQRRTGSDCCQKTPEREHGRTRTGCKAALRIRLVNRIIWMVSVFNDQHNHELIRSPSKKRNIRSQKRMSFQVKEIIDDLSSQNVGTSQILGYIAKTNGEEETSLKKKDVSNQIASQNKKLIGVDVKTTLEYFRKKQEKDPEFFFEVDADDNGVVQHMFWVDGRARRTWLELGDVITFDTTYNTNKYCMPLAPFISPNHHRHSLFYGMALMRSEKVKNFTWVFKTWLKAMYGKHPTAIITDQDPAMRATIKEIFPNSTHRCCQWHVMRKAREHLLIQYSSIQGFENELKAVINRSLTVLDFQKSWAAMLKTYGVEGNEHLKTMLKSAPEWVPAYCRGIFFADMTTTQRSESMNSMLKLWLDSHTSIYRFVQKIDYVIEGIWRREGDENIQSTNQTPQLWSHYDIEREAREVYTRNNFRVFKEILKVSTLGNVIEIERDALYEVRIKKNHLFKNWVPVSYLVEVDKANESYSCNCKGFEFEGFLCQHAIKVMLHLEVEHLPEKYILKRWCKDANARAKRSILERGMELGETDALQSFRKTTLQLEWRELEEAAIKSADAFAIVRSGIAQLKEDVKPMVAIKEVAATTKTDATREEEEQESDGVVHTCADPPISSCKGRKKRPGRMKPSIEVNAKQRRTCSYCHTKEAHNIRTCPKRLRDMAKGKKKCEEKFSSEEQESI